MKLESHQLDRRYEHLRLRDKVQTLPTMFQHRRQSSDFGSHDPDLRDKVQTLPTMFQHRRQSSNFGSYDLRSPGQAGLYMQSPVPSSRGSAAVLQIRSTPIS